MKTDTDFPSKFGVITTKLPSVTQRIFRKIMLLKSVAYFTLISNSFKFYKNNEIWILGNCTMWPLKVHTCDFSNCNIEWIALFYIYVAEITTTGTTAVSGVDFVPLTQISFESGEAEKCVSITILVDTNLEPAESFTMAITPGQNRISARSPNDVITVTIIDTNCKFHCWYI